MPWVCLDCLLLSSFGDSKNSMHLQSLKAVTNIVYLSALAKAVSLLRPPSQAWPRLLVTSRQQLWCRCSRRCSQASTVIQTKWVGADDNCISWYLNPTVSGWKCGCVFFCFWGWINPRFTSAQKHQVSAGLKPRHQGLSCTLLSWVLWNLGMMSPILPVAIAAQIFMGTCFVAWSGATCCGVDIERWLWVNITLPIVGG